MAMPGTVNIFMVFERFAGVCAHARSVISFAIVLGGGQLTTETCLADGRVEPHDRHHHRHHPAFNTNSPYNQARFSLRDYCFFLL